MYNLHWSFHEYEWKDLPGCHFQADGDTFFVEDSEQRFSLSLQPSIEGMCKSPDTATYTSGHGMRLTIFFPQDTSRPFVFFEIEHPECKPLFGQIVFSGDVTAREGLKLPVLKELFESLQAREASKNQ